MPILLASIILASMAEKLLWVEPAAFWNGGGMAETQDFVDMRQAVVRTMGNVGGGFVE